MAAPRQVPGRARRPSHRRRRRERGGGTFAAVSPRDGSALTRVADGTAAEIDAAVAAARRAFGSGPWPRLAPAERGRMLLRVADLIEERRAELADVARTAFDLGLPLLAVCRGLQVVDVALGGTLEQDMGGPGREHRHVVHPVAIRRGTLLEQATGAQKVEASCYHHQRVSEVAAGLTVTARAADGTVEGLELTGARGWFTAVQWHPEDTAHEDPAQQGLFDALVRAARQAS